MGSGGSNPSPAAILRAKREKWQSRRAGEWKISLATVVAGSDFPQEMKAEVAMTADAWVPWVVVVVAVVMIVVAVVVLKRKRKTT